MKKENVKNVWKHALECSAWKPSEEQQQKEKMDDDGHSIWNHFVNPDSLEPELACPMWNCYSRLPETLIGLEEEPANQVFGLHGVEKCKDFEGRIRELSADHFHNTWTFVRAPVFDIVKGRRIRSMKFIGAWILVPVDKRDVPDGQRKFLRADAKFFYKIQDRIVFDEDKRIDVSSPNNNALPVGGDIVKIYGEEKANKLIEITLTHLMKRVKM
jgi:hypothetical protein